MKLSIVSDVHITTKDDESFHLFLYFLEMQKNIRPDRVILLGDIFDLLAGDQKKYLKKYDEIMQKISELVHLGIEFTYFEGNHDMHLTKLFQSASRLYSFDPQCFEVERKYKLIQDRTNLLYFAHGDELEGGREYLKYKNFIQGSFMQWVANNLMPFELLEYVGGKASKKSRGINYVKYSSPEEQDRIQQSFRDIAKAISKQYGATHIFMGHSHLAELYSGEGFLYGNCGYFTSLKKFLIYEDGNLFWQELK